MEAQALPRSSIGRRVVSLGRDPGVGRRTLGSAGRRADGSVFLAIAREIAFALTVIRYQGISGFSAAAHLF